MGFHIFACNSLSSLEPHWCPNTEVLTDTINGRCGDYLMKYIEGYNINREASGLDTYDDKTYMNMLSTYMKNPDDTRECVFEKIVTVTNEACCSGWQGDNCDIGKSFG